MSIDANHEWELLRVRTGLWGWMKPNRDVNEGIQAFCLGALVMCVVLTFTGAISPWWWLAAYASHVLFYGVGSAIGSHRYYCHKTFEAPRWFVWVMLFFNTVGHSSTIYFTAVHLQHHRNADTEKDPHAPQYLGWRSFFMWRVLPVDNATGLRRFRKHPLAMWVHNRKNALMLAYALVLFAVLPATGSLLLGDPPRHRGHCHRDHGLSRPPVWVHELPIRHQWERVVAMAISARRKLA